MANTIYIVNELILTMRGFVMMCMPYLMLAIASFILGALTVVFLMSKFTGTTIARMAVNNPETLRSFLILLGNSVFGDNIMFSSIINLLIIWLRNASNDMNESSINDILNLMRNTSSIPADVVDADDADPADVVDAVDADPADPADVVDAVDADVVDAVDADDADPADVVDADDADVVDAVDADVVDAVDAVDADDQNTTVPVYNHIPESMFASRSVPVPIPIPSRLSVSDLNDMRRRLTDPKFVELHKRLLSRDDSQ